MYPDPSRTVFGHKSLSYIENDMANYISQKGILPVLLPDIDNLFLSDLLSEMDGFILQGGSDIAPETYNEKPVGQWKGDPYRDAYELKILDYAIQNSKPVFAICRGFQLMNVYFGGSLYQDIDTQLVNKGLHRSAEKYDTIKHSIKFEKGKLLDEIYSNIMQPYVNSVHHQAVKDLGKDLEIYAYSDDGIIEAFGYINEPAGKVFGVQWHPEFSHTLGDEVIDPNILYSTFLQHVRIHSQNKEILN